MDFTNSVAEQKGKWTLYEIYDDGQGSLKIVFLVRNSLSTSNPDWSVNLNEDDPEFVYPMIVSKVFDIGETYFEPICRMLTTE